MLLTPIQNNAKNTQNIQNNTQNNTEKIKDEILKEIRNILNNLFKIFGINITMEIKLKNDVKNAMESYYNIVIIEQEKILSKTIRPKTNTGDRYISYRGNSNWRIEPAPENKNWRTGEYLLDMPPPKLQRKGDEIINFQNNDKEFENKRQKFRPIESDKYEIKFDNVNKSAVLYINDTIYNIDLYQIHEKYKLLQALLNNIYN